jgi:hypothetical protein
MAGRRSGAAARAFHDPDEAARHDLDVESLVRQRVLGGPNERADRAADQLQIVERDAVILRHGRSCGCLPRRTVHRGVARRSSDRD